MTADRFRFFVSGRMEPVSPGGSLWQSPLSGRITAGISPDHPTGPRSIDGHSPGREKQQPVTIGDYFKAASQFLSENQFTPLRTGLAALLNRDVGKIKIKTICLHLEKHGAFYHPLKVETVLEDDASVNFASVKPVSVNLALNGAVSKQGRMLINKEYHTLQKFNNNLPYDYLPRVFACGEIQTDKVGLGFFLGQWFDEFKEFHVSENQGKQVIAVWHSNGGIDTLSFKEAGPIYEKIARILTVYYDIETFEQICAWHHAAGDFIVKYSPGNTDVRLITVRKYAAISEFGESKTDRTACILPALLIFFINLTIRIRLDRLDGTGRMIWLGRIILDAAVAGFFKGLDQKSPVYEYGDLSRAFIVFFKQFDPKQLAAMAQNVIGADHPDRSEMDLIRGNLSRHCGALFSIFKSL